MASWRKKAHRQLLERHGRGPEGARCGGCRLLRRFEGSTVWFKCSLTAYTGGAATDWRATLIACGSYTERDLRAVERDTLEALATDLDAMEAEQ